MKFNQASESRGYNLENERKIERKMISNIVFILALTHLFITPRALIPSSEDNRNHEQLLKFIRILNTQTEKRLEALKDRNYLKDLESKGGAIKFKEALSEEINENFENVLRVIQKNYDAYERNEKGHTKADAGIIYISNPEVIEEYNNGHHSKDAIQRYKRILGTKTRRSSSSSSSSDDVVRRNLKDILHDMRRKVVLLTSGENENFMEIRRNEKNSPKRDTVPEYSKEKAVWKNNDEKKPKKKKEKPSISFDKNPQPPRNKKEFVPRKRPVAYQSNPKKYDSYRPKKDSYHKKRDYQFYGRTSIPIVGHQAVYEKK